MPIDEYRAANRANWDDRAQIHYRSTSGARTDGYHVQRFIDDPRHISRVVDFDRSHIGEVDGRSLLHLQCHIGTDTLSWARLGATVTGIDFSERSIAAARTLSRECGTPGRFLVSELYDSPGVLDERFDVVYTGVGALTWLPEVAGWARVVAHFLQPGGTFYIRDGHPMCWGLDDEDPDGLRVRYPYFECEQPLRFDEGETYAGEGQLENVTQYEWSHGLGETITALIRAGLRLELVHEHKFCDWQALPQMSQGDDGWWRLPQSELVPLMFSIRAVKE